MSLSPSPPARGRSSASAPTAAKALSRCWSELEEAKDPRRRLAGAAARPDLAGHHRHDAALDPNPGQGDPGSGAVDQSLVARDPARLRARPDDPSGPERRGGLLDRARLRWARARHPRHRRRREARSPAGRERRLVLQRADGRLSDLGAPTDIDIVPSELPDPVVAFPDDV